MNPPPGLSVQGVTYGYHRRQPVVRNVTCEVQPCKLHILIGPNGCGKTTLLKLMLGEFTPLSGRVTIEGQSVSHWPARRRAAWISYVPQRTGSAFSFTAGQVVRMSRFALPPDETAVSQALADCDLFGLESQLFSELSVGQQQRVLLARAVAQSHGQGRVVLLDEPTSAMDLFHVHTTMRLLLRAASRGLGVVVVLQDLNLAARYADDVWLMNRGEMVSTGRWEQVLTPEVLEPVYGVVVNPIGRDDGRPVFSAGLHNPLT